VNSVQIAADLSRAARMVPATILLVEALDRLTPAVNAAAGSLEAFVQAVDTQRERFVISMPQPMPGGIAWIDWIAMGAAPLMRRQNRAMQLYRRRKHRTTKGGHYR
jgi:hypothetical protein